MRDDQRECRIEESYVAIAARVARKTWVIRTSFCLAEENAGTPEGLAACGPLDVSLDVSNNRNLPQLSWLTKVERTEAVAKAI